MSEPKRVHFETISGPGSRAHQPNVSFTTSPPSLPLPPPPPPTKQKSIRLELKLFEPNADTFPQFNYNKLCRAEKVRAFLPIFRIHKFISQKSIHFRCDFVWRVRARVSVNRICVCARVCEWVCERERESEYECDCVSSFHLPPCAIACFFLGSFLGIIHISCICICVL